MSERTQLATLKLHHDALNLSVFNKDNPREADLKAWLYEKAEMFAEIGIFLSTIACELDKGDHGASTTLVCYAKDRR